MKEGKGCDDKIAADAELCIGIMSLTVDDNRRLVEELYSVTPLKVEGKRFE